MHIRINKSHLRKHLSCRKKKFASTERIRDPNKRGNSRSTTPNKWYKIYSPKKARAMYILSVCILSTVKAMQTCIRNVFMEYIHDIYCYWLFSVLLHIYWGSIRYIKKKETKKRTFTWHDVGLSSNDDFLLLLLLLLLHILMQ